MITSYSNSATIETKQSSVFSGFGANIAGSSAAGSRVKLPAGRKAAGELPVQPPFVRYLPVDSNQARDNACLLGVGRTQVRPGERYPNTDHPKMYRLDWRSGRVLPEMQMLVLSNARGEFESKATGWVRIEGSAVVFLFPGVWHRYRPDSDFGWTERWISLNSVAANQLQQEGLIDPANALLLPKDISIAAAQIDKLVEHIRPQSSFDAQSLSQSAVQLIRSTVGARDFAENALKDSSSVECESDDLVDEAREIIWNHGHLRSVCVSDVARQLPVTRRTLDRRFAQVVGHSVLDEINSCRLWRAKRLLEETDLLIKTVSYLAGFPSRERMRLLFLCEEGVTPSEYRERKCKISTPV